MNIHVEDVNGTKVMKVEGRIDTATAPAFEDRLLKELNSTKLLRVDLGKVVYVSSAGLRSFLNGQKYCNKMGIEMILVNVEDTVMEVFEMTGFIDILNVEG